MQKYEIPGLYYKFPALLLFWAPRCMFSTIPKIKIILTPTWLLILHFKNPSALLIGIESYIFNVIFLHHSSFYQSWFLVSNVFQLFSTASCPTIGNWIPTETRQNENPAKQPPSTFCTTWVKVFLMTWMWLSICNYYFILG